jgi:choline transport protein
MDYISNSVVIVGIFSIVLLCWIERRQKFCGPAIDWDILNAAEATLE